MSQLKCEAFIGSDSPFIFVSPLSAGAVEIAAIGPPKGGCGQFEPPASLEGMNGLHAAFAIAARAHDDRPAMVLQASGDDFAGAGASPVNQAYHGKRRIA